MAKDFEMGYLLDFYGEVLTPKQREMLRQYYNDDLSLSEIGENFGGRDHTTVMHAVRKISQERLSNAELNHELHVLEQMIRG